MTVWHNVLATVVSAADSLASFKCSLKTQLFNQNLRLHAAKSVVPHCLYNYDHMILYKLDDYNIVNTAKLTAQLQNIMLMIMVIVIVRHTVLKIKLSVASR